MRQLRPIIKGSVNPSTYIRIWNPLTNLPTTTVIPGTTSAVGLQLSYCRAGGAVVNFPAIALASAGAVYASGGLIHLFAGNYRLFLPAAAVASAASVDDVIVGGVLTGMVIVGAYHELVDAASASTMPTRLEFRLVP